MKNNIEMLLRIIEVNGDTFGKFIYACRKKLGMGYGEACEWLHYLKKEGLVVEDRMGEWFVPNEERDYKNYCIHFIFGNKKPIREEDIRKEPAENNYSDDIPF